MHDYVPTRHRRPANGGPPGRVRRSCPCGRRDSFDYRWTGISSSWKSHDVLTVADLDDGPIKEMQVAETARQAWFTSH
ncbi:MAG TPA: hypothetical protein VGK58_04245 [Lacipirellulaceae bacterium]